MSHKNSAAGNAGPTRRDVISAVSVGLGGLAMGPGRATAPPVVPNGVTERISHSAESIHHEVELQASPARVYAALTDATQFDQVTLQSAAVRSGMVLIHGASEISSEVGGSFSLFGGHITGRIIERLASTRLVQAWRSGDWVAGTYSIARFELTTRGAGTLLVFDHLGFPIGQAEHLAEGWRDNYWSPLRTYLGQR
jgi:activator of HSP90 ATPase